MANDYLTIRHVPYLMEKSSLPFSECRRRKHHGCFFVTNSKKDLSTVRSTGGPTVVCLRATG